MILSAVEHMFKNQPDESGKEEEENEAEAPRFNARKKAGAAVSKSN